MELDEIFTNATRDWLNSTFDRDRPSNPRPISNSTIPATVQCSYPYFYAMGVVIPSGLVSNIFCLIVFTVSVGLRRMTTGHYLTALACADSLFLIGDFMRWINTDGCSPVDFRNTSEIACKLIFWLRYGAKLVSAWVTVAIATERFITVAFPLKVSSVSTAFRAKVVIVLLFIVGFSLGSYTLFTLDLVPPNLPSHRTMCKVLPRLQWVYNAWNTSILAIGTLILPGIIISILTTITVVILMRASRRRREHMEGQTVLMASTAAGSSSNGPVRKSLSTARGSSAERQLTVTLVAVCLAFIVLRLPYCICYVLSQVLVLRRLPGISVALKVTDVIATSNYVVNLMLYCLCGSYFRQQVLAVYGCRRRARRHNNNPFGTGIRINSIMKDSIDYSYKSRCSTATRSSLV